MLLRTLITLMIVSQCAFAEMRHIALAPVSGVSLSGMFDVSLHTGYSKHPEIILHGNPKDLAKVAVYRNGDLIQLDRKSKGNTGPIRAEIRANQLKNFNYRGFGQITGNKIHANRLNLYINNKGSTTLGGYLNLHKLTVLDSGYTQLHDIKSDHLSVTLGGNSRVQLTGIANLTHLDADGNGWLGMYWVNSHVLTVRSSGGTQLQLAGVVDVLDVELAGNACFKGRFLRARTAFVKTHDKATAEMSAIRSQHTLALDASDIYFYNISEFRTDFMGNDGSVLDMRAWEQYAMKDYNIYNK